MKTFFNFIKKITLYVGLLILIELSSCREDDQSINVDIESLYDQEPNLKREFGRALLNAMKESKMLRSVLKTEALKMFDKDYDVLYYSIEDKLLENNISVKELMAKHLGGRQKLNEILLQSPTLTIFVPELPNHSFSAELWNTHDVPAVAIWTGKRSGVGGVPFIKTNGHEDAIPREYIPAFPILVIKDNERVVALNDKNHKWFSQLETKTVYNGGWVRLKFWNKDFDPSKKPIDRKKQGSGLDPKIKKAYEIYKNDYGWHRDYIYYDITPSDTIGQYNNEYKEYIETFSMDGDPEVMYKVINHGNYWTDGFFEFAVSTTISSKHDIGQIITVLSVCSDDLFTIKYKRLGNRFRPSAVSVKTASVHLPLFGWKLEEYCSGIKLHVDEVDLPKIATRTENRRVGYATNFSINPTSGFLEKTGFGAGLLDVKTKTYEVAYFKTSDFLGETIIEFSDAAVVLSDNLSPYFAREYSTGACKVGVAPVKIN